MKGLPLAYNKDMQEDKEPLFDAVDTLRLVVPGLETRWRQRIPPGGCGRRPGIRRPPIWPTTWCAGLPFREAHEVVGASCATASRAARLLQVSTPRRSPRSRPCWRADPAAALAQITVDVSVARRHSARRRRSRCRPRSVGFCQSEDRPLCRVAPIISEPLTGTEAV